MIKISASSRLRALAALVAIFLLAAAQPGRVNAAAEAADNATNDNIGVGNNGGANFALWSNATTGGGGGTFTGTSIGNNHLAPGIDTGGKAWGLYANGATVGTDFSRIARLFTADENGNTNLLPGQTFTIDMDIGFVATSGIAGFSLQNGSSNDVFTFKFIGGGNTFQINGANPAKNIGYTNAGLRVKVTLTSATTYSVSVLEPNTSATILGPNNGNLLNPAGGQGINSVLLYADGSGAGSSFDVFFNSMSISNSAVPVINLNPINTTVCSGSPATFTVAASGTALSYAWLKHANLGWGSPWTVTNETSGTIFLNSSTDNNNGAPNCNSLASFGDINTSSGNAWGLYGPEQVSRTFPAALTNGQVFQIDMDNGAVNTGLSVGFSLHNAANAQMFSFYFPGGSNNYVFFDANGNTTTSIPFTVTGLRVAVIVGPGNPATYTLVITPCGGMPVQYTGTFVSTGNPDKLLLYNNNTTEGSAVFNVYFNNLFAGLAYDNADNYGVNWSSLDSGDASAISGATNDIYTTSNATNGDLYYAIAYNNLGADVSTVAGVTMFPPRTTTPVLSQPGGVAAGQMVTITEVLTGGTPPFDYQWLSNGVAVGTAIDSGSATNSLQVDTTGFATGSYTYSVVATNCSGSATSAPVTLNVVVPSAPVVLHSTSPGTVGSAVGATVVFQASFTGTAPISYQWEFTTNQIDYTVLPGATGTTLTLSNVQVTNAGFYSLWASNAATGGFTVSSGDAQLAVGSQNPGMIIMANNLGMAVTVNTTNGTYAIGSTSPAWNFGGSVGGLSFAQEISSSGVDSLGGYGEIDFNYTNNTAQLGSIRLYHDQPIVLFSETALAPTPNANFNFPKLTSYPAGLSFVDFVGLWGIYSFSTQDSQSPWLFFDANFNSFVISSATNYMIASNSLSGGTITCGINGAIPTLPAGFTHRVILTLTNGINNTYNAWGNALTTLSGKTRVANDAAVELNKFGYWTDNGGTYYYNFTGSYPATLTLIRDEFNSLGFPLGYMQIDSWWYPKGAADTWEGDPINNRGGLDSYTASPTLFPAGLASFQEQLGLPLITHARWIDPASPYQTQYAMSANVSVDPRYWATIMSYIQNAGVVTYEQDWMNQNAAPLMNLNDPPAFMNDMASAAATNGLNLQYCMPTPAIYLQSSLHNNLATMRVCPDVWQRSHWDEFLYDSRLVTAVGAYPWTDVEYTGDFMNVLLGTLSSGPVGFGDAIGTVNAGTLELVARTDSVIVKPDAPLLPMDQTYSSDAQGNQLPMVASTYTDFGSTRAWYVFSYARNSGSIGASFTPTQLGATNNVFIYDYFGQSGTVMSQPAAFNFTTSVATAQSGASYFVVSPIGASGIALIGDTNKFVTLGKKRISAMSDSGILRATVAFAAGESSVTLSGYAPSAPSATINNGSVIAANYNAGNHWFTLSVPSGGAASANVALSLNPANFSQVLQIAPAGGGQYVLTWNGGGTLLQSTNVAGPYTTNAVAASPYQFSPTGSSLFFKLVQ